MSLYELSQLNIPLDESWDIIVVGGGPAGCAAAVAAGREGAKVLLVEATGTHGGMRARFFFPAIWKKEAWRAIIFCRGRFVPIERTINPGGGT